MLSGKQDMLIASFLFGYAERQAGYAERNAKSLVLCKFFSTGSKHGVRWPAQVCC
jgi:hypothetical protein